MQIVFVAVCSLFIVWAFEIRHKEAMAKLNNAMDDIEKLKDALSSVAKQLKTVSQRLSDIGLSTS